MSGSPRRVLTGVAGVVVGLGCLGLTAPHVGPLNLQCIDADGAGGVRLACLGAEVHVRAWVLASLAVACTVAPIVLLVGLRDLRSAVASALRRRRVLACTVASVALLVFTLVPIDESREVLLGLALGSAGVVCTAAGLVAAAPRLSTAVTRLAVAVARRVGSARPGVFLAAVSGFFFLACALGSSMVFGGVPHFVDEMDQLFHARMFLEGRVSVPTPVPLEAFDLTHMVSGDTWYSMYPPGHTLLLSIGLLLGAPWVVNALFGALCVVLLYLLGREIYGESVGRIAAVLGAASPFWLLVSSSFMSHTTTEFFFLLFLLFFARMARHGGVLNALVAGAALGYGATIRQTDVVAVALPMAVYAAWRLVARAREPFPSGPASRGPSWLVLCVLALAAFAVPVAGFLAFNDATNGSPWLTGPVLLYGENYLPGFGNSGFGDTPHTPMLGLQSTWGYFASLNQILFGWPLPSLLFAILGLSWLRPRLWDWLLGASVVALAGVFATYWYHDLTLGPRYMFTATGLLVLLTARSLHALAGVLRSQRLAGGWPELQTASVLVLVLSAGYAATVTAPWMARFYSRDYFDGNARVVHAVEARDLHNALVFVPPFLYPNFFALNAPLLNGDVVYARDLGEAGNREVITRYPGRSTYKVHSLEAYEVLPYPSPEAPGDGLYVLAPGRPLEIEALATQMGFFDDCMYRERKTGELGGGWKNNDHLEVIPRRIEAGIGFAIAAGAEEVRSGTLALSRGPGFGAVRVYMNDAELCKLDLYAPEADTLNVPLPELRFKPGINVLHLKVVGQNPASTSWGFAVDSLSIARAGEPPPGGAGPR